MALWRYLESGGKRAAAVWHRRAGKDEVCLHWAAVSAMQKPATYWHMLPLAVQARRAIWEAVNPRTGKRRIDEAFPHEIRETTREQEMMIRFVNGSTWQVVGSDNYDALVGSPPYGVVFSEWSLSRPSAWDFIRPILADNGGWAFFIYTPRGRNHGNAMLRLAQESPEWFAEVLTVDDTQALDPAVLANERRELVKLRGEDAGEAIFQQEYYCSFDAAIPGSYYGRLLQIAEKDGRIGRAPYDPTLPVTTAWDLGIGDSTAIWFAQQVGREVHVIDHYEHAGVGLDHYVKMLAEKPYRYARHILPHDAEQSELGTGTTRRETLFRMGVRDTLVLPAIKVDDGINAVRMMLPRVWMDAAKCEKGLDALRNYQREWSEDLQMFKDKPLHDWSSHSADAFRYLAQGLMPGLSPAQASTERYPQHPGYGPPIRADYDPMAGH
jgi:phage terminase large subunit